ncbi:MAG TPA: pitrilysin family protein [Longimicrobiaceae bacterium]|nr:pitrilysin family protein [Longimicrobiaceae bacterium]
MNRFIPLLLGCVAAVPLAPIANGGGAAADAQEVRIPHTVFELPNGLRFVVHEDHSTPIAAVNVWYHVGSGYEEPGRTGFAHLFEHIMFEGSKNVPEGDFDNLLEAAGGQNNGSTNPDRTNYYETVPSSAVELALWLEADRMGGLLETMSQQKLDVQRDVVKNERRQSYENRPYGMLWETAAAALYPAGHPYSWSTIGSMADLSAASLEDVESFFRRYYAPNNAVVVVAGDVSTDSVRAMAERLFGWIPRGEAVAKPEIPMPQIAATRHLTLEDRVTLPQLTMIWRTTPRFAADEAAIDVLAAVLTEGKNSRLYQRLVYEGETAQSVNAFNRAQLLSGDLYVQVMGREGTSLGAMEAAVLDEVARIAAAPPSAEEVARVVNGIETGFVRSLQAVAGKADQLNSYLYYTGAAGYAPQDLARYRAVTPADVQRVARDYLTGRNRVVISIVPQGKQSLAAGGKETE